MIKATATKIADKFFNDHDFKASVMMSPEPYRAMMHESGLVPCVNDIDGSELFWDIIEEVERQIT